MADLLELEGAVVYRVLAYRRAAKSLRETAESVARLSAEGRLTSLPGVGRDHRRQGRGAPRERRDRRARQAREAQPARRDDGDAHPGHRPEDRPADLHRARSRDRRPGARGRRGPADPRASTAWGRRPRRRSSRGSRTAPAPPCGGRRSAGSCRWPSGSWRSSGAATRSSAASPPAACAGSPRPAKDIDIVAAVTNRLTASEAFVAQEWVAEVASRGDNRIAAVAHDGTRRRAAHGGAEGLRQPAPAPHRLQASQRGAARGGGAGRAQGQRVRHRGRRERRRAGVRGRGRRLRAGSGMAWIPPELRENRGEIEAARQGRAARSGRDRPDPRRPAHAHRLVGRQGDAREDGRGAPGRAGTAT